MLIIDEVDTASDNVVWFDFLALLRAGYLARIKYKDYPFFRAVILAGVTDVKRQRARIRAEGYGKGSIPFNIATTFNVDLSFAHEDVVGMLSQYESDHAIGMDVALVANEIVAWTGGHPSS